MRYYWYISLPFNCSIIKGQAYWKIRSATPLQTFFIFFPSIEWTDHPSCAPSLTFAGPRLRLSRCSSWWWRYPEAWVQSDPICSKLPETSSSEPYTVNYHVAWIQNHKPSSRILYIVDYIYIHYIYISSKSVFDAWKVAMSAFRSGSVFTWVAPLILGSDLRWWKPSPGHLMDAFYGKLG